MFNFRSLIFLSAAVLSFLPTQVVSLHQRDSALQSVHRRNTNRLARNESVQRRGDGALFTHYVAGMGACGGYNSDNDHVVALNAPSWDGGSHCGQTITVTVNGESFEAKIVDECMGCGPNDIDFSTGFFSAVSHGNVGMDVMHGSWQIGSGAAQAKADADKKAQEEADQKKKQQEDDAAKQKAADDAEKQKEADAAKASSAAVAAAATSSTSTSSSSSSTQTSSSTSAAAPANSSSTGSTAIPSDLFGQLDLIMVQVGGVAMTAFHSH